MKNFLSELKKDLPELKEIITDPEFICTVLSVAAMATYYFYTKLG